MKNEFSKKIGIAPTIIVFALIIMAQGAQATGFTFPKVADTSTLIPGGTGTFTSLENPAISRGNIAFIGSGTGEQQGIYRVLPSGPALPVDPLKIADILTPIPGGTGTFTGFSNPINSASNIAFIGTGTGGQQGIYRVLPVDPLQPNDPIKIADLLTPIPGGTGSFSSFAPVVSIDGNDVAFMGYNDNQQSGLYALIGEELTVIADTNTQIPGGDGNFVSLPVDPLRILNGNVAFIGDGSNGQEGVYLFRSGVLTGIADTFTNIPDITGLTFDTFNTVSYDGLNVVFVGSSNQAWTGVYRVLVSPGPEQVNPVKIADTGTAVPGGTGNFLGFGKVAADSGVIVFEGTSSDGNGGFLTGLYTELGGSLSRIIAQGDTLNGKNVSHLEFGDGGFSDNQTIFAATFQDGSQSITSTPAYNVIVSVSPESSNITTGSSYLYNITVNNTGNEKGNFTLIVTDSDTVNFTTTLGITAMQIDSSGSAMTTLNVTAKSSATTGAIDNTTVTVISVENPAYINLTKVQTMVTSLILPPIRFINGTVKDNSTGNNLAGVNIYANSTLSTTTNTNGFYSFAVIEGIYNLTATLDITYYTNTTTVSTIGKAVAQKDIILVKKPTGNISGTVYKKWEQI